MIPRTRVLHPFWLAVYPVMALLAHNVGWSPPTDALRPFLIALVGAALLLGITRWIVGDWLKAGLIASLILLLFFSYGHVYGVMKTAGWGASVGRHRYLAPAFGLAFLLSTFLILRRLRDPAPLTSALNWMSAALVALPVVSLGAYILNPPARPEPAASIQELHLPAGAPPDVYYIILDAYARQDTLQQVYEYDNGAFIGFLRERGFYVADGSRSNYAQTGLSLSSSMNMNYIDALVPELESGSRGRQTLWELIQHSEVRRRLEALGYETVAFSTGLPGTEIRDADVYLRPGTADETLSLEGSNPFESMLAQTTMLRLVSDGVVALPRFIPTLDYPYQIHRTRIRYILDTLADLPASSGPRFVFAHVISPHPPFVFGPDGEELTPDAPFTLKFTFDSGPSSSVDDYLRGYRGQVVFVNREIERVIDSILAHAATTPVIIIQGDHGPDSSSTRVSYVQERMTNLNAYLLPTGDAGLYPTITPVNSFRVMFNELFGGTYEMLPDRVLYSQYQTPYSFFDVTDAIVQPAQ